MFFKNKFNITFNSGQRADLSVLEGVLEVIQVFPDVEPDDELFDAYILEVEEDKFEELLDYISELPEIKECEKIPIRMIK